MPGEVNVSWGPDFGNPGKPEIGIQATIDALALETDQSIGVQALMDNLALEHEKSIGIQAAMDNLTLEHNKSIGIDVSELSTEVINMFPQEDTFLDRANGDTVNGAENFGTAKNNTPVVNDDRKIYIAWDLTNILGSSITSATMSIWLQENVAVGDLPTQIQIYTNAAKPFEEDTATWNNTEQPPGTLRQTAVVTVSGNVMTRHDITLDATTRANMLGNWLYARIVGPDSGADVTNIVFATLKENASNDPRINFTVQLNV